MNHIMIVCCSRSVLRTNCVILYLNLFPEKKVLFHKIHLSSSDFRSMRHTVDQMEICCAHIISDIIVDET